MRKERYIVHVDMDAFFAAVEQRDNPAYRGKPVIVGADPKGGKGRGVVATCSYEARAYGIHSAMPISKAYKLCPHGIYLPPDMEKYCAASRRIRGILYDFTPHIEAVSIDEAFLDITSSCHLFGTPEDTCLKIKWRIREDEGLTASVGLAPTKMAAKIASDLKKPDGFVKVTSEGLTDFLWPLPLRKLWGLGPKSEKTLNGTGIFTIGDLARTDMKRLTRIFGKNGFSLWQLANGIDGREVISGGESKSVSNETTFDEDTDDEKLIESTLMHLCEKVSGRLRQDNAKGRTVTLKLRLEGFHTHTRSRTMPCPANFVDNIFGAIIELYKDFDRGGKKVRLLGVRVAGFGEPGLQQDLFTAITDEKREKMHKAVDRIKKKFGDDAIHRAR